MGSLIDKSEEDREARIQSRLNNYNLGVISQHDYTYPTKTATFVYTTKETEHCYAVFSNFLFDYYTDPREFHKCIIHQTRSIICILDILTKYDLETNSHVTKPIDSIFYCRASYSSRWILRSWPSTYLLNYESGKKILKIWDDNATQNLMYLLFTKESKYWLKNVYKSKYTTKDVQNSNFTDKLEMRDFTNKARFVNINIDNNDEDRQLLDDKYYDYISSYRSNEYPLNSEFVSYFLENVLSFCYKTYSIETKYQRDLIKQCWLDIHCCSKKIRFSNKVNCNINANVNINTDVDNKSSSSSSSSRKNMNRTNINKYTTIMDNFLIKMDTVLTESRRRFIHHELETPLVRDNKSGNSSDRIISFDKNFKLYRQFVRESICRMVFCIPLSWLLALHYVSQLKEISIYGCIVGDPNEEDIEDEWIDQTQVKSENDLNHVLDRLIDKINTASLELDVSSINNGSSSDDDNDLNRTELINRLKTFMKNCGIIKLFQFIDFYNDMSQYELELHDWIKKEKARRKAERSAFRKKYGWLIPYPPGLDEPQYDKPPKNRTIWIVPNYIDMKQLSSQYNNILNDLSHVLKTTLFHKQTSDNNKDDIDTGTDTDKDKDIDIDINSIETKTKADEKIRINIELEAKQSVTSQMQTIIKSQSQSRSNRDQRRPLKNVSRGPIRSRVRAIKKKQKKKRKHKGLNFYFHSKVGKSKKERDMELFAKLSGEEEDRKNRNGDRNNGGNYGIIETIGDIFDNENNFLSNVVKNYKLYSNQEYENILDKKCFQRSEKLRLQRISNLEKSIFSWIVDLNIPFDRYARSNYTLDLDIFRVNNKLDDLKEYIRLIDISKLVSNYQFGDDHGILGQYKNEIKMDWDLHWVRHKIRGQRKGKLNQYGLSKESRNKYYYHQFNTIKSKIQLDPYVESDRKKLYYPKLYNVKYDIMAEKWLIHRLRFLSYCRSVIEYHRDYSNGIIISAGNTGNGNNNINRDINSNATRRRHLEELSRLSKRIDFRFDDWGGPLKMLVNSGDPLHTVDEIYRPYLSDFMKKYVYIRGKRFMINNMQKNGTEYGFKIELFRFMIYWNRFEQINRLYENYKCSKLDDDNDDGVDDVDNKEDKVFETIMNKFIWIAYSDMHRYTIDVVLRLNAPLKFSREYEVTKRTKTDLLQRALGKNTDDLAKPQRLANGLI